MYRLALPLLCLLVTSSVARAQFSGMKYRIPRDANTLILINAEKMFGSPVADRQHWAARRQAAYDAGMIALPPDATEVVLAGRKDLEYGKTVWELGLMKLRAERNVVTVAQRYGGAVDELVGRSAVRLPNDQFVVQLTGNLFSSYTPANRQEVSRWLRSTDVSEAGVKLSNYLEQAFGYATRVGTPIVMAMDLEHTISEAGVKARVDRFDVLEGAGLNIDQLAQLVSGVKGITLGVTIKEKAFGAIRVDFTDSPKMLAEIGKPLLIQILQHQGAMLDDLPDWKASIEGNTFLLQGDMSEGSVRRVMSVLELPPTLTDAVHDASSPGNDTEGQQKVLATQQYFKTVSSYLDDLRGKPKRDRVKTFGQAAIWYDKYARKIDRLPILGVDEEMLNYGAQMAGALRDAEMTMKGVGMRTSVRTAQNQPTSGGYGYSFGGYRAGMGYSGSLYGAQNINVSVGAGQASLRAKGQSDAIIRGEERTRGAASVQEIWRAIDEATSAIRRKMVSKYSADF